MLNKWDEVCTGSRNDIFCENGFCPFWFHDTRGPNPTLSLAIVSIARAWFFKDLGLNVLSAVILASSLTPSLSQSNFKRFHLSLHNIQWEWVILQYVIPNLRLTQKYAFIEKYTIFTQSLWNLVKLWYSWVAHFDQVS